MNIVNRPANKSPRSNFVTVLAWILIVFSGVGTFISILQNVMINFLFPVENMQQVLSQLEAKEHVPAIFIFLATYFRLIFLFIFVLATTTLVSSIALLKRKNWARIAFIMLMSLGIIWNIGVVLLQQYVMPTVPKMPVDAQINMPQFEAMVNVMKIAGIVMAIGFSVLFGWIIKRLISPDTREEFQD